MAPLAAAQAEFRRESIEGVLSRQHEAEEAAKLAIEARDAARDAAQRAAEAAKAAALEARNEGKYSDFRTARARAAGALLARQAQLEGVGAKFAEKMERAEAVLRGREEGAVSRRFLVGKLGRERLVRPAHPPCVPARQARRARGLARALTARSLSAAAPRAQVALRPAVP